MSARCSLCRRGREDVAFLVAPGPEREDDVLVCDGCVDLCADILADRRAAEEHGPPSDGAVLDPVAWYRRVVHEGRGRTVMACAAPGRHVGFAIYDEPDSPEGRIFYTPLHAVRTRLPGHIRAAVLDPAARMALCRLISVGGAPLL